MTHTQIPSTIATEIPLDADENMARQFVQYHPSIWGDYFVSHAEDRKSVHNWCKEVDALKERIRKELNEKFTTKYSLDEQLNLIDVIQRLGIAYQFEGDIHQAMQQIFDHHDHNHVDDHDHDQNHDIHTASLRFRLLREHGFNVSCDVFNKFKYQKGNFKESLTTDVFGLLSLYEASHLRVHGEDILEEALIFTSSHLQSMVPKLKHSIAKQVMHALRQPIRKGLTRLHAWDYFTFYQENESHDEVLLRFAKLNFNILQNQHRKELSILAKWWKRLDFQKNLPFARDRLVECYFWILGVYYEPQYALARNFLTKVIALTSTIDDIYDVYGTKRELELFTEAIERWDTSSIHKLPEYMKICYQALQDVYDEMEEEIVKEGRSYAMHYAKEAMKKAVKAYHEESKWLNNKVPTMEEYMKVALVSSGYQLLAVASLVGMGEIATKTTFDWLDTEPQILQASCLIARLMDDIVSHKFEQEREHIPSAVQCYMNQHGVSERQACIELNKQVVDAWKDINEAFTKRHKEIAMPVLTCLLNLSKVIDLLYTDEDGYTNVGPRLKHYVACMFINPIIV